MRKQNIQSKGAQNLRFCKPWEQKCRKQPASEHPCFPSLLKRVLNECEEKRNKTSRRKIGFENTMNLSNKNELITTAARFTFQWSVCLLFSNRLHASFHANGYHLFIIHGSQDFFFLFFNVKWGQNNILECVNVRFTHRMRKYFLIQLYHIQLFLIYRVSIPCYTIYS